MRDSCASNDSDLGLRSAAKVQLTVSNCRQLQGKKWAPHTSSQTQLPAHGTYKSSVFERLTDDVVVRIFSFLPSSQLALCGRVCRRWHVLAWEPQLWSTIVLSGDNLSVDRALKVRVIISYNVERPSFVIASIKIMTMKLLLIIITIIASLVHPLHSLHHRGMQ